MQKNSEGGKTGRYHHTSLLDAFLIFMGPRVEVEGRKKYRRKIVMVDDHNTPEIYDRLSAYDKPARKDPKGWGAKR